MGLSTKHPSYPMLLMKTLVPPTPAILHFSNNATSIMSRHCNILILGNLWNDGGLSRISHGQGSLIQIQIAELSYH